MSMKWSFYQQKPTDNIQNPISGEFFSTESVGNLAEALIREAFQNSLDARLYKEDGTRVPAKARVFVSGKSVALSPRRAAHWFGSLRSHLIANNNGLREQPKESDPCPFLVYEDFGTTGLNGDIAQHLVKEGIKNDFLNFFRAEGHSDKGEHDRGSWGVGKTVFPRSSRVSTFIGLTVRSEDKQRFLLGRSILKYHSVNTVSFKSDGYYGIERNDGLMLPSGDVATITEFSKEFHLKRESATGLSIVIPWYEDDVDDGITFDNIVGAIFRGFFYPILMGHLSATIANPEKEVTLNTSSLLQQVNLLPSQIREEIQLLIEFAEWAKTRIDSEFIVLGAPPAGGAQQWGAEMIADETIKQLRTAIEQRQRIAVRVPMTVHPKEGDPEKTYFDVFIEYSGKDSERPVFIRDELVISDVKASRNSNVRSIVIVENGPLANLLRDAETPAHTQWNTDTRNFKNKYKYGPGAIRFVRNSVSELLRLVNQAEKKPDPTITIDFFSIPAASDDEDVVPGRRKKPQEKPGPNPPPPFPPLPPRLRRFRLSRLAGGFSIRKGDEGASQPSAIEIAVAYDVRRGNPLRKYSKEDFDLKVAPIKCEIQDQSISVTEIDQNRMLVEILKADFGFEVTGFDVDRDLYIRAEVKENANVD